METFEKRYISEITTDVEKREVRGRVISFETPSNILMTDTGVKFQEVIKRGSIDEEFLSKQDIVFLYNHNENSPYGVLARSNKGKGSLKFSVDDAGVNFSFRLKQKDSGIMESLADGDLDKCSFAFKVDENDPSAQTISKRSDGIIQRDINKFQMIKDFSIVPFAAYDSTTVSVRSIDQAAEQLKELEKPVEPVNNEAEEKEKRFKEYYNRIRRKYLS